MAIANSADWIIGIDSDEFLESGSNNMTLKESIKQVDSEDYNLIQFDRFDFFMTDNDNESAKSIREKMPYYSCQGDFLYRAWKYCHGTRVEETGAHYPIFPEGIRYKIYPRKFPFRHYTFRSKEHAEKKMADRLRNWEKNTKIDKRNDSHYNKMLRANYTEKIDHKLLTKYEEDKNWNLERKYCPFLDGDGNHPTRDKIITVDGWLKTYPLTVSSTNVFLIK